MTYTVCRVVSVFILNLPEMVLFYLWSLHKGNHVMAWGPLMFSWFVFHKKWDCTLINRKEAPWPMDLSFVAVLVQLLSGINQSNQQTKWRLLYIFIELLVNWGETKLTSPSGHFLDADPFPFTDTDMMWKDTWLGIRAFLICISLSLSPTEHLHPTVQYILPLETQLLSANP